MIFDLFNQDIPELLEIRVTPKASSNRIKIEYKPDGSRLYKIYVTAIAEDGKANKAVIELLAKELKISKSFIEIIKGLKCRDKIVKIIKTS